ncbi:MAG: RsmB/NOP family class I SAM-dependent RNA methyltransferase [Candidatus Delongbacteria bacterium]
MKAPRPQYSGARFGRRPAPAPGREQKLAAWLRELAQSVERGQRPDLELSRLLRRDQPEPALRRRLVAASAAWFRWSSWLGAAADPLRDLARATRLEELAGGEDGPEAALRELEATAGEALSAAAHLPGWLRAGLPAGLDAEGLARAFLRPPSLWLRAVAEEQLREGLGDLAAGLEAHARLAGAWRLRTREDLYDTPGFRQGHFVLQDPASQAIGAVCQAQPGEHWLDLCAGAGGKSLQLAAAMAGKGLVHAFDIHLGRLEELKRRARRQGVFNLQTRAWDGHVLPALPRLDGVLVDAPCTNSGTLRRNPDLWRRRAPDLAGLAELQDSLLDQGARQLRPGGRLVYATCSVLEVENEARVAAFLARQPGFRPLDFENPLDGRPAPGRLRVSPLDGDQDGTFMAIFRKE